MYMCSTKANDSQCNNSRKITENSLLSQFAALVILKLPN